MAHSVCLSLLCINHLSVKHFLNNRLTHGFPPAMLVRRGSNPGGCKSTIDDSQWLIMSDLATEIILSSLLTVLYTTTVLCFSNLLLHTSHSAQHYTATHSDIWWMALKQCPVLQSQSLWIHGISLIWVINLSCQIWHKPHNVSDSNILKSFLLLVDYTQLSVSCTVHNRSRMKYCNQWNDIFFCYAIYN